MDGVPQIEYILAIGKIVYLKTLNLFQEHQITVFAFFFVFNKLILYSLMQITKRIFTNDRIIQICRLIKSAKKFIICNVYRLSIPNQTIVDAFKKHINYSYLVN